MAYNFPHFVNDKPVGTDDVSYVIKNMRENLFALLVASAYGGTIPNWDYRQEIGVGTIRRPQNNFYTYNQSRGLIEIRLQNSWIEISGVERLVQVQYAFTLNGGQTWDTMAVKALSYTDGIVTSTTWVMS